MKWSQVAVLGITFFVLVLSAGCSSQSVQVTQVTPVERHLRSEILDIRNCDSNEDMHTNLASEAPILYQVSLAKNATAASTGAVVEIPSEKQAILETEIVSAYQHEYEGAVAIAEQVELMVPAQMIYMYDIKWKEQVYSATVSFSLGGQACLADYTYSLEIPDLVGRKTMACTA
jgi:hypothetical protein